MATTAKRVKDGAYPKAHTLKPYWKKCNVCRGKDQSCPKCKKNQGKIFTSRRHNRCKMCGRPRAYLRKFGICRLCFRGLALRGEIPGVSKSSW